MEVVFFSCSRWFDLWLYLDSTFYLLVEGDKGLRAGDPLNGLDRFPLDRVIEIHVAGASEGEVDGYAYVEDDHTVQVLPETWTILEYVANRALNLKAVVFECERNPMSLCLPGFSRIADILRDTPMGRALGAEGRAL